MATTMTGRERFNAVFRKQPVDRLCWTTLVDNATLGALPEPLRGMAAISFYRHIGCDVLMLNGWATPHGFSSPALRWPHEVETRSWEENGCRVGDTHGILPEVRGPRR